jgi:hypothetical protein
MKYTVTIEIEAPLGDIIPLFDAPDNWPKWRDGFISAEHLRGDLGSEGSKTKLVNRVGGRDTLMIETVERNNLPAEMTCTYEAPGFWLGAWNRVTNRFRSLAPDRSEWQLESEFRCRGLLKVMSTLMPSMFREATLKEMNNFKAFVESYRRDA